MKWKISIAKQVFLVQLCILSVGFILSSYVFLFINEDEKLHARVEFEKEFEFRFDTFEQTLLLNLEALQGMTSYFYTVTEPKLKEFQLIAEKVLNRHKSIKALEWAPVVYDKERSKHEAWLGNYYPNYSITEKQKQGYMIPAAQREIYVPVSYIVPLLGNQNALGFDLLSNKKRATSIELSRDTSRVLATEPITLVQESGSAKAFLAFIPIYEGLPVTIQQRKESIKGFLLGVFNVDLLLNNSMLNGDNQSFEFSISDITTPSSPQLIYGDHTDSIDALSTTKNLQFWGREWLIKGTASDSHASHHVSSIGLFFLLTGLVLTLFVTLYIGVLYKQNRQIAVSVKKKTRDLYLAKKKLEALSQTDGLTGISNRRHFDDILESEWLRACQMQKPISLLLVDIDDFKAFNDNYGHMSGDNALKAVATTLKEAVVHDDDLVARYGGEEFAIILPETDSVTQLLDRLLDKVRKLKITHEYSSSGLVTISIGCCIALPCQYLALESLLNKADEALYRAKEKGKNQAVTVKLMGKTSQVHSEVDREK